MSFIEDIFRPRLARVVRPAISPASSVRPVSAIVSPASTEKGRGSSVQEGAGAIYTPDRVNTHSPTYSNPGLAKPAKSAAIGGVSAAPLFPRTAMPVSGAAAIYPTASEVDLAADKTADFAMPAASTSTAAEAGTSTADARIVNASFPGRRDTAQDHGSAVASAAYAMVADISARNDDVLSILKFG